MEKFNETGLITKVKLDKFVPRPFQRPLLKALLNEKKLRLLAIWPRRAGKDMAAFYGMIVCALERVGMYIYLLPTAAQARKVLFDGVMNDGTPILDLIPKEAVASKHIQDMKIKLKNGSVIIFSGSDNYDRLMGINAHGIVFSEYALQDARASQFMRPILTATQGWALYISTPRGSNHLWSMYNVASTSPEWFCSYLTVEDTQHISVNDIKREIAMGDMSEELAQQEYWCSWIGMEGSYYSRYLDNLRLKTQITDVPWEPSHPVYTACDIGVADNTSIIWFQVIGQTVRIIDCYEKNREGIEHYINLILNKPYTYGKHFAPHDMKQMEFGSGMTRWAKAYDLGIQFTVVDNIPIIDGIEIVRSTLPRCWFNEETTRPLLKALENYRQAKDIKHNRFKGHPVHDNWSHYSDAFRYLCIGLKHARKSTTPEELERRYQEAVYGPRHTFFDNSF